MLKQIIKIIAILLAIFSISYFGDISYAADNLNNTPIKEHTNNNDRLNSLESGDTFTVAETGGRGIRFFIIKIAKDAKNVFFAISTVFFLVLVFRFFFGANSEEESTKFKKGILWIVVGIVLMQLSYTAVFILFGEDVNEALGTDLLKDLFMPIINMLLFISSLVFLAMAIMAFYMIITASGDEEKAKKGKMTIVYALGGFLLIKFADILVNASYSETYNTTGAQATDLIDTMSLIINWITGFTALAVVLMIMYTGSQLMFGFGDEEKVKKAKKSIVYIAIGLIILVLSYLITTFFIIPETTI